MKRFLSSRSSSQQELQPVENLRAERAAIALSVGLSWPPDRYTKTSRGRRSRQQLWERALQEHIMNRHELPQGIRLQRRAWWRPGEAIDRPLTHEELAHIILLFVPVVPCVVSPCYLTRPLSSFCVSCPGFPYKKKFVWGEGKSDGLKWCPHQMISAHMLAYTAGNRP